MTDASQNAPNADSSPQDESSTHDDHDKGASDSGVGNNPSRDELEHRLEELNAEVTRLRARQARSESKKSWVQRHPVASVVGGLALGAAAGYGAARLFRSRPPETLSGQARQRLQNLTADASKAAKRLQKDWGDRAATRGRDLRERAAAVGKDLMTDAQTAGETLRKEATSATERAQRAGEEAGTALRDTAEKTVQRVREAGESAASEAEDVVDTQLEALSDTAGTTVDDEEDASTTALWLTVGGIVAGGYLATKLRQWC